jgi:hypothetical protein
MNKMIDQFSQEIFESGYSIFENIVPVEMLVSLRLDIPKREAFCKDWQRRNGVGSGMAGAAHHVVGGDDSLNDFLHLLPLDEYIHAYFGNHYILNSYGALDNLPNSTDAYKHGQRFHRDVRTYSGNFRLMLNMLVMVHDFTIENGATKLVPGSHKHEQRPEDILLEKHAVRATGTAGSIILFDSNLWHSAAPNTTQEARMALTLTFTRPFYKQQMDYPRLLGESFPVNEKMRQLLGYNSRVPVNHNEWYQPPEKRMYKPGQG